MNQESFRQEDLEAIKDQFSSDFLDGKEPTLAAYIARYPQFSSELTDFILTFAQLQATPLVETAPTAEAEAAMMRALSASRTRARTIIDRVKELGITESEFTRSVRAPMEIFALFHRNHVARGANAFYKAVAKALSLSELQSRRMLAPQALAFRAQKGPQPVPKSFGAILDELKGHGLISPEDYDYWKEMEAAE